MKTIPLTNMATVSFNNDTAVQTFSVNSSEIYNSNILTTYIIVNETKPKKPIYFPKYLYEYEENIEENQIHHSNYLLPIIWWLLQYK